MKYIVSTFKCNKYIASKFDFFSMEDHEVEEFIAEVQSRPALWNKNLSSYKNSHKKKRLGE